MVETITTTVIDKQPVLTNKVIMILLWQYNKGMDEPLVLLESERMGCWDSYLEYTFFRAVGDMPTHYEEGDKLSEADTMLWLCLELNKGDARYEHWK